ncbi:carbohydrate ABC transporter permease, partial [Mesorhizobium sp. M8A.F.Ca.ET.021.01.1.1]
MAGANERTERNAMNGTAAEGLASSLSQSELDRRMRRRGEESRWWWIVPTLYIIVLLLPIYWLINMSFKTNAEIVNSLTLYPHAPTIANYVTIFTQKAWYSGYINSITYVV